jgi:hypothetical protein
MGDAASLLIKVANSIVNPRHVYGAVAIACEGRKFPIY